MLHQLSKASIGDLPELQATCDTGSVPGIGERFWHEVVAIVEQEREFKRWSISADHGSSDELRAGSKILRNPFDLAAEGFVVFDEAAHDLLQGDGRFAIAFVGSGFQ